jgi:NAD(P)-dependent dehydrogenase (short-subunit alcohol dehydrogenase family)
MTAPGEQRVAVVTGAASGIGRGIAQRFAADGLSVIATDRDELGLRETVAVLRSGGARCEAVAADLTADAGPATIVDGALTAYGRIDVLVHTAGILRLAAFADAGPEVLDEQYAVNVRAPYALTHAALPFLKRGAAIVFVSSNLAQVGFAGLAAYCGTKGAVDAMARSIALELAPSGIRVNTVAPGIVLTPLTHRYQDPAQAAEAIRDTPVGRLGAPEDIAAAVAFVSSDAAGYMVGSTIVVDGGWNAR